MANTADSEDDVQTLSSLFDEGLELYNKIGNNQNPTNSPEFQQDVKKAMKLFERSTQLVSITDIFSRNEGVEELATNDLKYFLLPALLGSLSLKLTSGDRKQIVDCSEVYFKDFLNRTNDYGLSNFVFKDKENIGQDVAIRDTKQTELDHLAAAVNTRAHRIQRYKEQKDLKSKMEDLKRNMDNENVDDEIKRNYYITMIKLFIHEAIDELNSIEMEKPILEHMANISKEDPSIKPLRRPPPPLKPIIITRDEVQKAVYGAGYPGLPTMTVQEFYDKRVADGIFPDPNKKPTGQGMSLQEKSLAGIPINDEEKEKEQDEKLIDEDDDENIQRMRAKDEYKDDHRRGWGNRMNRS